MHILITGASGFLGKHLVQKLLSGGHNLRLVTRKRCNIDQMLAQEPRVRIVEADLTKPETLQGILTGSEVVYNLAGILGQANITDDVYWQTNYQSTGNLLKLCVQEKTVRRFIHCSSAGVQGPIENPPADESFPYAPSNIYETTKAAAEKMVLEYQKKHNFPVVVLRPEFVYGPGDLHVLGLFKAIGSGRFVVFGDGSTWLHPTYIDDAVQACELALDNDAALGQVYIIAGERAVTVRELADQIADTLKVKRPRSVPMWIGRWAAVTLEEIGKAFSKEMPFNRARLKFFTQNRNFKIDKAHTELGYQPQFNLARGLASTVDWYKQEGYL
ncbi:MAG: NAD(P)-dependent oxidoreductase [Candidatus Schekmanbacteria bacterium]|nr:NAD(P)-dependent oxidoreductase [Candidatus Schekmanbacteria bacterium]